jgi:hypothetical protein
MAERRDAALLPERAMVRRRSRKRWGVAAVVVGCWAVLLAQTGSFIGATALLAFLAALGVICVLGFRALGITRDHPWVRQLAARPWRDGQDVLQLSLRHLSEVFVITPSGSLLAPNLVEVRLNPHDLSSLTELMDVGLINASAAEVYEEQVAAHGARLAGPGPVMVSVFSDPSVPAGRYWLRQGQPLGPGPRRGHSGVQTMPPGAPFGPPDSAFLHSVPEFVRHGPPSVQARPDGVFMAHDGSTCAEPVSPQGVANLATVAELVRAPVPWLRLVTGDSVAQTRTSGARAGRGAVELGLPDVPTVSREHARFTFADGRWWIANLGMNGLTVNGNPLLGEQPVSDGDSIRWGTSPGAPLSRVEIG